MFGIRHDLGASAATQVASEPSGGGSSLRALLATAARFRERLHEALAPLGLAYPTYRILEHLGSAGRGVDATELALVCRTSLSSTVRMLEDLAREGSVRLVADLGRGGEIAARLTREGANRVRDCAARLDDVVAQFAAGLAVAERAELGRLLDKVADDARFPWQIP